MKRSLAKPGILACLSLFLPLAATTIPAATITEFDWFVGGHVSFPTTDQINNPSPVRVVHLDGQKTLSLIRSGVGNLNNEPQSGTARVDVDLVDGTIRALAQMAGNNGVAHPFGIFGDTISVGGPGTAPVQFGLTFDGVISSQGGLPIGAQVIQLVAALALDGVILPPEVTGNFSDLTRPFNGTPGTVPGLLYNNLDNILFLDSTLSADGPISGEILTQLNLAPGTYQVAYGLNVLGITRDINSQWTADLLSTANPVFNVPVGYTATSAAGATYLGTFDPSAIPAPPTWILLALGLAAGFTRRRRGVG